MFFLSIPLNLSWSGNAAAEQIHSVELIFLIIIITRMIYRNFLVVRRRCVENILLLSLFIHLLNIQSKDIGASIPAALQRPMIYANYLRHPLHCPGRINKPRKYIVIVLQYNKWAANWMDMGYKLFSDCVQWFLHCKPSTVFIVQARQQIKALHPNDMHRGGMIRSWSQTIIFVELCKDTHKEWWWGIVFSLNNRMSLIVTIFIFGHLRSPTKGTDHFCGGGRRTNLNIPDKGQELSSSLSSVWCASGGGGEFYWVSKGCSLGVVRG